MALRLVAEWVWVIGGRMRRLLVVLGRGERTKLPELEGRSKCGRGRTSETSGCNWVPLHQVKDMAYSCCSATAVDECGDVQIIKWFVWHITRSQMVS